jgi:hypothetical protein
MSDAIERGTRLWEQTLGLLDDFYVSYELNAYTREAHKMSSIYSQLHERIQDQLHASGIEIASPHLSAVRDGNRANIPDPHLPQDYEPPAFRVHPIPGLPGGPGGDPGQNRKP